MSGHRRQVIESWIDGLDEYGIGQDQWIPAKEHFEWVCKLALKGLDADLPEGGPFQCPWATYGTHMCREAFAAREKGLGSTKLRYPLGDERNRPEDDPYYFQTPPQ